MSFYFFYKKTSELTQQEIIDSLYVFNTTFGSAHQSDYFDWKYKQNVYGDSLHVIGYDQGKPILSRAFWRNDIGDQLAYQPVDTAVLPEYQKKGLFKKTALDGLKRLESAYIYNYPNDNSLPGYLRAGWNVKQTYYIGFNFRKIVISYYKTSDLIDDEFVKWRFVQNPFNKYAVCKEYNEWFLLSERQPGYYAVLGRISRDFNLKQVNPVILFSYDNINLLFKLINKRKVTFVENTMYTQLFGDIPSYRFDML